MQESGHRTGMCAKRWRSDLRAEPESLEIPAAGVQDAARWQRPVSWPEGRQFAFTIFDDPDGQSLETSRLVYRFLADLGLRTTVAVWPLAARRDANSGGETCANSRYL